MFRYNATLCLEPNRTWTFRAGLCSGNAADFAKFGRSAVQIAAQILVINFLKKNGPKLPPSKSLPTDPSRTCFPVSFDAINSSRNDHPDSAVVAKFERMIAGLFNGAFSLHKLYSVALNSNENMDWEGDLFAVVCLI